MGFTVLPNIVGSQGNYNVKTKGSLSYRRVKYKTGAKQKDPRLLITIPKFFTTGMDIKKGDHFVLMIGDGEDVGKARLIKSTNGEGSRVAIFSGAVSLRFGYVPMLGHDAADKEDIDVRQCEGGFEIDLPRWFTEKGFHDAPPVGNT
jgi:hypothetical protein